MPKSTQPTEAYGQMGGTPCMVIGYATCYGLLELLVLEGTHVVIFKGTLGLCAHLTNGCAKLGELL